MYLTAFYVLILSLILIVDIRERRIMNVVALPAALIALIAAAVNGATAFALALSGALAGFLLFFIIYWVGERYYGAAALGFGDVKLAMLIGAMLGLDKVLLALCIGMLLAGLCGLFLLISKRANGRSTLPYGAFLAFAGILFLLIT